MVDVHSCGRCWRPSKDCRCPGGPLRYAAPRALTLWPEWLPMITRAGKDVENRGWPAPLDVVGTRIALHAGASIGGRAGRAVAARAMWNTADTATYDVGELVGAELRAGQWGFRCGDEFWPVPISAICVTAVIGAPVRDSASRWAFPGGWHWPLLDTVVLPEPVPCSGAQGLWRLPEDVVAAVLRQH